MTYHNNQHVHPITHTNPFTISDVVLTDLPDYLLLERMFVTQYCNRYLKSSKFPCISIILWPIIIIINIVERCGFNSVPAKNDLW